MTSTRGIGIIGIFSKRKSVAISLLLYFVLIELKLSPAFRRVALPGIFDLALIRRDEIHANTIPASPRGCG